MLYTARGVSKHEVITGEVVTGKYGIAPHQYVDFAILRGDPSDGLPGVKGIGDKTAATLLDRLVILRDHRGGGRSHLLAVQGPAGHIIAAADYSPQPRVVRVARDLPVGKDLDALRHRPVRRPARSRNSPSNGARRLRGTPGPGAGAPSGLL